MSAQTPTSMKTLRSWWRQSSWYWIWLISVVVIAFQWKRKQSSINEARHWTIFGGKCPLIAARYTCNFWLNGNAKVPLNTESNTFISASESSPVHWEKFQPSGKQHNPGHAGTAEILIKHYENSSRFCPHPLPLINVLEDFKGPSLAIHYEEVFIDPCDIVVFECALNQLVEEIRWQEFMNVHARKVMHERLYQKLSQIQNSKSQTFAYHDVTSDTKLTPDDVGMETLDKKVSFLMRVAVSSRIMKVFWPCSTSTSGEF